MRWRTTGVAYEVRESTYTHANRSFATVDHMLQDGVKVAKWGLFSDIAVGPFPCFGVRTEFGYLLKKSNDKYMHVFLFFM